MSRNKQQFSKEYYQALKRPLNFNELGPGEQWAIDKSLCILDWDPPLEESKAYMKKRAEMKEKARRDKYPVITKDPEANVIYIKFNERKIESTVESMAELKGQMVMFDLDKQNNLVGIEIIG